jgi:c-di-GMP-binding flagellar brake protein YcgR
MAEKFVERRRHVRIPMVSVIEVRLGDGNPLAAMLVDLSAGGARIMCQFPLNIGEEVVLKIPLFEERLLELAGDVVWSKEMEAMKEYNFGVEYMGGVAFKQASEEIREFARRHTNK